MDDYGVDYPVNSDAPVFLTGFARSGTTWLNRLFYDYFDAGFVNEGQFIVSFGRRLHRYGNLSNPRSHNRLLRDLARDTFFTILRNNYAVEIDWIQVKDVGSDFAAIVLDVLRQIAERLGKHRIGSKYPVFGRYIDLLNSLFPDCRVVHVVRDGRDCALSHKKMIWGHQNTYAAAIHWRNYLYTARRSAEQMPDRYLEIRYEDILIEPERTMQHLEHFIVGENQNIVTQRFLKEHKRQLRSDKLGQWRKAMSPRSQAIFEAVAGDALCEWGYPLTGVERRVSPLFMAECIVHDRLSREAWYWMRKMFPSIPEHKPWS